MNLPACHVCGQPLFAGAGGTLIDREHPERNRCPNCIGAMEAIGLPVRRTQAVSYELEDRLALRQRLRQEYDVRFRERDLDR